MAVNKTKATEVSVTEFIQNIENETRRNDSFQLVALYQTITGFEPKMWGPTIIGFGIYHYKYASGHEGEMPIAAFSPRKDALVFYISDEIENREELLEKLGKHKKGKVCIYVKKLADIDITLLQELVIATIKDIQAKYPD